MKTQDIFDFILYLIALFASIGLGVHIITGVKSKYSKIIGVSLIIIGIIGFLFFLYIQFT